jgi:hypothetical protein
MLYGVQTGKLMQGTMRKILFEELLCVKAVAKKESTEDA